MHQDPKVPLYQSIAMISKKTVSKFPAMCLQFARLGLGNKLFPLAVHYILRKMSKLTPVQAMSLRAVQPSSLRASNNERATKPVHAISRASQPSSFLACIAARTTSPVQAMSLRAVQPSSLRASFRVRVTSPVHAMSLRAAQPSSLRADSTILATSCSC
jgi:hypothetical protein